jgi:SAM-dependent methyltransferase
MLALSTSPSLRATDGSSITLDIDRYFDHASDGERRMLEGLVGSVIDLGSGPGRLVAHLQAWGTPALGVDISSDLVVHARRRGGHGVVGCVFDPVPFEGRWHNALLLDGNVGIGGDPVALLARVRELLVSTGRVLVEVDRLGGANRTVTVSERVGEDVGPEFAWALISLDGLDSIAEHCGFRPGRLHRVDGRCVRELVCCA